MTTESDIAQQMMDHIKTKCPKILTDYDVYYNSGTPGKRIQLIAWCIIQFLYKTKKPSEQAQAKACLIKLGFNVVRLHEEKKWALMPTERAHLV